MNEYTHLNRILSELKEIMQRENKRHEMDPARQAALLYNMRNMATVLWSVDPQDWMRPGSSVVAQRIVNGSHPGAVVLSHDIHGRTVRAMPATIDGLAARGLECVTLSELMGWPRWDRRNLRLAGQS